MASHITLDAPAHDERRPSVQIDSEAKRRMSVNNPDLDTLAAEAQQATDAEHGLGFLQSLKLYPKAVGWSVFLSTCVIMEGFDITLIASLFAYPPFQRKFGVEQDDGSYQLTAAWQSGLTNGMLVGQIMGLFISGIVAERVGYRWTLIGALSLVACFIFIIFFAETLPQLLAGEILIGVPFGTFQTLTVTYASEVCPVHLRAYLTTYVNLCWVLGQLLASGLLRAMVERDDKWGYKIPFAVQWAWPVPLAIAIFFAPESPWWLVRRGRLEAAKRSVLRLTRRNASEPTSADGSTAFDADRSVAMMVHTNELERALNAGTHYTDCFRGTDLRRTEIVCATWAVQTFCGASFMGFSTYFYQQAGMDVANSFSMSLGQYAIGAVGTISSWFLMRWFGRRTLYLAGQALMVLFLTVIGCVSFAGRDNAAAQWAIGSLLLIYTLTYNCTVGPVCYSLVAELSSTRLKTKTVVLARNVYNISGMIPNVLTPLMLNPSAWNWGAKAGFFWAGTCGLCFIWTFFRLPEPKGRTYGELDVLFEQGVSARRFASTTVHKLDGSEGAEVGPCEKGVMAESVQVEKVSS
ncbi:general alpha-glucoside permease [Plectosphaerella cucumerina]|uniref:General alpha-glucoside permease n=1 Tax=Plectosphaerella cucumerina TaxID=40658 RepID=A0A8K0TPL7_9PEZI|nr:general alpha-glucoside permease [Plectosphaerella cucumerina]